MPRKTTSPPPTSSRSNGRRLTQTSAGADAEAQKLEDTLAQNDTTALLAWRTALPERASVEQLESLLARERDDLSAAKSGAATLQAEIDRQTLAAEPASQPNWLPRGRRWTERRGRAAAGDGATASGADAARLRQRRPARDDPDRAAAIWKTAATRARMRLLAAQLRDRQRRVSELNQHVATLENLVLDRTEAAASPISPRASRRNATGSRPSSGRSAKRRTRTFRWPKSSPTPCTQLSQLRAQQQDWETWRRDTAQALKNTEERIRIGGVSEAVGLILLAEKSRLKSLPLLQALTRQAADRPRPDAHQPDRRARAAEQLERSGQRRRARHCRACRRRRPNGYNDLRTSAFRLLNTRAEIVRRCCCSRRGLRDGPGRRRTDTARPRRHSTEKLDTILDCAAALDAEPQAVDAAWFGRSCRSDFGDVFRRTPLGPRGCQRRATRRRARRCRPSRPRSSASCSSAPRRAEQLEQLTAPMRRIRTDRYRADRQGPDLDTVGRSADGVLRFWMLSYACRQAAAGSGHLTEENGLRAPALVMPGVCRRPSCAS